MRRNDDPLNSIVICSSRLAFLIACLLTILPAWLRAEAAPARPGAIVLEGQALPFLHRQSLSHIQVFAFHSAALTPIPFQIDERDRRGRWVIKAGPRPSRDDQPGRFDPNDAIVFLRRDMGQRATALAFPTGGWHEVRLGSHEPPLGFVYIRVGVKSAQPTRPGLVRYDPQQDHVYAEGYSVAFDTPLPSHLAFVESPGDLGQNLISGVAVAAEVNFLGGLLNIRRTDKDLHARLYGYTQGPVRVIRRARYWFPLPFGLRARGRIDLIFYPNFVEGTALVKLKIPPRFILADGEVSTYFNFLDFGQAQLLQADESPVEEEQSPRWAALQLPTGQTLLLVTRLEGGLQKLTQQTYFSNAGPPHSGQPSFGFHFSGVARLDAGSYRLSAFGVLLETTDPEVIQSTATFFLSPPRASVTPIGGVGYE